MVLIREPILPTGSDDSWFHPLRCALQACKRIQGLRAAHNAVLKPGYGYPEISLSVLSKILILLSDAGQMIIKRLSHRICVSSDACGFFLGGLSAAP
jgi:hypothetical protein